MNTDPPKSAVSEALERIRQKLDAARSRDWSTARVIPFGLQSHRLRQPDPMTEDAVAVFEQRLGIGLPEDYRAFLLDVGQGGAGPHHGLVPLNRWAETLDLGENGDPTPFAAKPYPIPQLLDPYPAWVEAIGGIDWGERLDRMEWHPYQGTLAVSVQGCSFYTVIAVNGPLRGRSINVDIGIDVHQLSPFPSFLSWYDAWLTSVIEDREFRDYFHTTPPEPHRVPIPW